MAQVERLKARLEGENYTDALLSDLLESAKYIIFEHRFPYSEYPTEVEPRYQNLQLQIAVELFGKLGADGQTGHSENGITRTWASADVSPALLNRITPVIKVVSNR